MSKILVSELSGTALDYAVALAEGYVQQTAKNGLPFLAYPSRRFLAGKGDDPLSGLTPAEHVNFYVPAYSTGPAGDDIIDREGISVIRCDDDYGKDAQGYCNNVRIPVWAATTGRHGSADIYGSQGDCYGLAYTLDVSDVIYGGTRREAAMRCYVASNLGAEVEIPKELA